jgi:hypothetical protein
MLGGKGEGQGKRKEQMYVYSTISHAQQAIFVHGTPATSFGLKHEPSSGHEQQ